MKHNIEINSLSDRVELKLLVHNGVRSTRAIVVTIDSVQLSGHIKFLQFRSVGVMGGKYYYVLKLKPSISKHPDWEEIRREILLQASKMNYRINRSYIRNTEANFRRQEKRKQYQETLKAMSSKG